MTEEKRGPGRPVKSMVSPNQELVKVAEQFDAFDESVKEMTKDRLDATPKQEVEQQTKMSSREVEKNNASYIKPYTSIGSREKFNENFRDDYNFAKEYVNFIAENKEIIGETLEFWTKPFVGMPAEFWKIPCNKPIWAPRYVAEQIKRKYYHRLVMQENRAIGSDGAGQYYGSMAADTTVQRLDAIPVSTRKSVFMGANSF